MFPGLFLSVTRRGWWGARTPFALLISNAVTCYHEKAIVARVGPERPVVFQAASRVQALRMKCKRFLFVVLLCCVIRACRGREIPERLGTYGNPSAREPQKGYREVHRSREGVSDHSWHVPESEISEQDSQPDEDSVWDDDEPSTELVPYPGENRQSRASRGDIKEEGKSDSVQSYYEFLINEGSYKFWAAFQLGTAALLIYSAFAAVYYAKYTYATTTVDYDDYDFFFKRSGENLPEPTTTTQRSTFLGLSADTYQRILDAISKKKDS